MSWSCKKCEKNFNSKATYYRHRKLCETFHKNIYKNCVCGKPFFSKTSFYVHIKSCEEKSGKNVKTCDCGTTFHSKSAFYLHRNSCNAATEKTVFKVCECGKSFLSKSSYYGHKKNCTVQNENDKSMPKENYICQENNCTFSCSKQLDFLDHIKTIHAIESYWEEMTFQTYEEFEDWKEQFEKSTKAAFKVLNVRKTTSGMCKNFICNRSGSYTSQSTGKRAMKSQGLTKIGFNCTACIRVHIEEKTSAVKATICNFHYGHDKKICHLRIPKSDRASIANQLRMGIEHSRIQRNLYTEFPTELQRQHMVTKADLRNISKSYGIKKIKKHSKEHLSVKKIKKHSKEHLSVKKNKKHSEENLSVDARVEDSVLQVYDHIETVYNNANNDNHNDAICQNQNNPNETSSEGQTFDENYIFIHLTGNVDISFAELKSNLLEKTMALHDIIKNCDSKYMLLAAREHINIAASVLNL